MRRFATLFGFLLLAFAASVGAADLDELRQKGVVGERFDGLAVVRGDDSSAKPIIEEVNGKRRSIYAERAKAQNAPAGEVGKVYAKEIAEKAPTGTWFLGEDGKWVQKK